MFVFVTKYFMYVCVWSTCIWRCTSNVCHGPNLIFCHTVSPCLTQERVTGYSYSPKPGIYFFAWFGGSTSLQFPYIIHSWYCTWFLNHDSGCMKFSEGIGINKSRCLRSRGYCYLNTMQWNSIQFYLIVNMATNFLNFLVK